MSVKITILIALLRLIACSVDIQVVVPDETRWKRVENLSENEYTLRLGSLEKSWLTSSKLDCITKCNSLIEKCFSVQFDDVSKNCTAGTWIVQSNGPPSPQITVDTLFLYTKTKFCDERVGFSYVSRYNDQACIYVSGINDTLTYADAEDSCEALGALLYMSKTIAKFDIFVDERKFFDDHVYLGLKDPTDTNEFYWADGERFWPGTAVWETTWNYNQPDDVINQLCGMSYKNFYRIYDFWCNKEFRYACEIPLV